MTDDFKPSAAFDVSDENGAMLANHMRALQREVHSGFEMITQKLLTAIDRLNQKLDDLVDWKNEVTRWQADTDRRLAALEKAKRRKTARKK